MSYEIEHKIILQSMMWAKCLSRNELIDVFKKLQINENQVDTYITLINSQIDRFNMSIQRGMDSQTGDVHYALICISGNRISKMSSVYSAEQLEVLKAALELIITKNGRFKPKKIVKMMLNKNVKFPVIKDIYSTIEEFVKEKYFKKVDDYYYIEPRGLIEFNMYFRNYYKEFVNDCTLCKQICARGLKCKHCSAYYHKVCAERFSNQQDNCIACNKELDLNESFDSVASVEQENETQQTSAILDNNSDYESAEEAMELE